MARGTGPLFSLEATGSIGDALTYGKRGKANVIKRKAKPANPRTMSQIHSRTAIAAGNAVWRTLTDEQKELWKTEGEARQITGFNAQTSHQRQQLLANLGIQPVPNAGSAPGSVTFGGGGATGGKARVDWDLLFAVGPTEGEWYLFCLVENSVTKKDLPQFAVLAYQITAIDEAISEIHVFADKIPAGTWAASYIQCGTNGELGVSQYLEDIIVT